MKADGVGADDTVGISARPIPQEPMVHQTLHTTIHSLILHQYLIVNLGMSENFGDVDVDHLTFPNHML